MSSRQPECTLSKYRFFAWVNCTYILVSSSSMWSQFCNKYKQDSIELSVPDMPSYIVKQSAAAANAFLSTSHKKGSQLPVSDGCGSSSRPSPTPSDSRSDSALHRTPGHSKNERPALRVLDILLGRD